MFTDIGAVYLKESEQMSGIRTDLEIKQSSSNIYLRLGSRILGSTFLLGRAAAIPGELDNDPNPPPSAGLVVTGNAAIVATGKAVITCGLISAFVSVLTEGRRAKK
jgi:hypothetical protein